MKMPFVLPSIDAVLGGAVQEGRWGQGQAKPVDRLRPGASGGPEDEFFGQDEREAVSELVQKPQDRAGGCGRMGERRHMGGTVQNLGLAVGDV
ncbi:MAG: hypothetical protein Gyms2KO_41050 [Gymnodinialimonas sp.]